MKKRVFLAVFAILVVFGKPLLAEDDFFYRVAAKCTGESDFAVPECVCTVYNRLRDGWTEETVLSAYYAYPEKPSPFALWITREVLSEGCDESYYFMFSGDDVLLLGISDIAPMLRLFGDSGEVWLYEENYMQRAYYPEDFHGRQIYG